MRGERLRRVRVDGSNHVLAAARIRRRAVEEDGLGRVDGYVEVGNLDTSQYHLNTVARPGRSKPGLYH